MKPRRTFQFATSALALLVALAVQSAAANNPNGKKITFTTKSKEAVQLVEQAIRGIENFQGGTPAMLEVAQKAVAADPEFAFAHYLVGTFTPPPANQEHMRKAIELAKKASDGERLYIDAVVLVRTQKTDEAIKMFLDLEKQYPEERMIKMMLGQAYMNQGKVAEAQASFEKAMKLDGSTARVHSFLGNALLLRGEYGKARDHFKSSLSKSPTGGVAPFGPYNGLAHTFLYEGKPDEAYKVLSQYLDAYNSSGGPQGFPAVFIWNAMARVKLEHGNPAEAITLYEKGYETVKNSSLPEDQKLPWLGRLHHGRGRALAKMGKREEAWKEADTIKQMIETGGEAGKQFWPSYHYIAGYLKLEDKDYAKAVEHLKQADMTDPFHKFLLARAYEGLGDQTNAHKLYEEVVAVNTISIERALTYMAAKKKLAS